MLTAPRSRHQDFELIEGVRAPVRAALALLGDDYAWLWCSDLGCEVKRLSAAAGEVAWSTVTLASPGDALIGSVRSGALLVAGSRLLVSVRSEARGLIAIGQLEALEPSTGSISARATPWDMSTQLPTPVVGWHAGRTFVVRNFQAISEAAETFGVVSVLDAELQPVSEVSLPPRKWAELGSGTSGLGSLILSFDGRAVVRPSAAVPLTTQELENAEVILSSTTQLTRLSASASGQSVAALDASGLLVANFELPEVRERIFGVAVDDSQEGVALALGYADRVEVWIVRQGEPALAATLPGGGNSAVTLSEQGFGLAYDVDGTPHFAGFSCPPR